MCLRCHQKMDPGWGTTFFVLKMPPEIHLCIIKVGSLLAALPPAGIFHKKVTFLNKSILLEAEGRLEMGVWGAKPPNRGIGSYG